MNWFERYGIVGTFFFIMTGIWYFCLFPDTYTLIINNKENVLLAKYIAGFCGLGILPIGYLIVVFGQWLYYRRNYWRRIHCECWKYLDEEIKNKIKEKENLSDQDQKNEAKMESIITYYDRFNIEDIDRNKFLSSFGTKRYDVIAINRGLAITIFVSLFCAICLKLISLSITLKELFENIGNIPFSLLFAFILAIVILIILQKSSSILENQIIEITIRKSNNIKV